VVGENVKMPKGTFAWLLLASPVVWFAYRKIWVEVFAISAVLFALILAEEHYEFETGPGAIIGASIVLGFVAKDLYFERIYQRVEKYKKLPSNERKACFLKRHSGTSTMWAVPSIPISIIAAIALLALYAALTGGPVFVDG